MFKNFLLVTFSQNHFCVVVEAYTAAMLSMARLNRTGAKMMHKYGTYMYMYGLPLSATVPSSPPGSHGATDVTGFGILGHLRNLVEIQKADVSFTIDVLPSMFLC